MSLGSVARINLAVVLVCLFLLFQTPILEKLDDGLLDQAVTGKMMVIYSMKDFRLFDLKGQGMFADVMHVVGAIRYGQRDGALGVRVFFDTDMYTNKSGDNYWSYFFNPEIRIQNFTDDRVVEEVHFNRYLARFGKFGTFSNVAQGKRKLATTPFPLPSKQCGKPCGVESLGEIVKQYIKPRPAIIEKVQAFRERRNFGDKYVIGVHYRGTDMKLKRNTNPSYECFAAEIDRVIESIGNRDYIIFLASDEAEVVPWMVERYGDKITYNDEFNTRISKDEVVVNGDIKGSHMNPRFSPYEKGISVVTDCLLLASCDYIIKGRSSVSDVALLFNKQRKVNFTFIIDDQEMWQFAGDDLLRTGPYVPGKS
eukprot:TRINITY_DN4439_c0_g2_i1.p1 TRINITY_DN4439_c0_g2~~TRINITY_DN4439_c0_g2_i1.p1  ORF type:complete len:379 (+),score=64.77 TRINITY_DN4439_c0_g2_i1:38-1138(+)